MKNMKKVAALFTGALILTSCGGMSKKEATQKTVEAIVKEENYDSYYEKVTYGTHTDSKNNYEWEVSFQGASSDLSRFDVKAVGDASDYSYYAELDVIFTNDYAVEGVFTIEKSGTNYFLAQFTLTDDYTPDTSKFRYDYENVSDPNKMNRSTGTRILTSALSYSLRDLSEFMSAHDIEFKTFFPKA